MRRIDALGHDTEYGATGYRASTLSRLVRLVDLEASRLLPAYFAAVMATGIVSIATHIYGLEPFSAALLYLNVVLYVVLWALTAIRIVRHTAEFVSDFKDPYRGSGFFTIIAGTNTLGSQLVVLRHDYTLGYYLWLFGLAQWFAIQYSLFSVFSALRSKPPLERGLSGTWLVAIVSTESVAVLGVRVSAAHPEAYLVSVIMYMVGWLTYPVIITMINQRLFFYPIQPSELTGPYWINMGATAITTLAGSLLVLYPPQTAAGEFVQSIRVFVEGLTFLIWAYGSWWIPWLLIMGFWRHVIGRVSMLHYDPSFWGAVFPLGMYTVATHYLVEATGLRALSVIPDVFVFLAVAAWVYEFAGMVHNVARKLAGTTT